MRSQENTFPKSSRVGLEKPHIYFCSGTGYWKVYVLARAWPDVRHHLAHKFITKLNKQLEDAASTKTLAQHFGNKGTVTGRLDSESRQLEAINKNCLDNLKLFYRK